jgi:hypothetical protein
MSLTPFLTPTMLLQSGLGVDWGSYPDSEASPEEQLAAQMAVCWDVTSTMAMEAGQGLRASVTAEQDFGPDRTITILRNGWARMQLRRWPVLQIIGGQWSGAIAPQQWNAIPTTSLLPEIPLLASYGTIVGDSSADGPNAILVAPGIVTWWGGRLGTILQITYLNGWPVCGIDTACVAGATSVHVDDITGWWNGTTGARGVIQDPPWREDVTVTGAPTPDTVGANSGPGTLPVTALQFPHTPIIGKPNVIDQTVLLTTMPSSLLRGGYYFAAHYGLLRGAQAAVMQTTHGQVVSSGVKAAADWYSQGQEVLRHYARAAI